MFRIPVKCFIAIGLCFLCACSNNPKNQEFQGFLATQIMDNGSKQFVYSVVLPETSKKDSRGNGRPGNVTGNVRGSSNRGVSAGVTAGTGGGKGKTNGKGRGQDQRISMLNESLNAELKRSGYCREGYMELDRMMQPGQTYIKGECEETATSNDRKLFPNEAD